MIIFGPGIDSVFASIFGPDMELKSVVDDRQFETRSHQMSLNSFFGPLGHGIRICDAGIVSVLQSIYGPVMK